MKISEAFGKNQKTQEVRKGLPVLSLACIDGSYLNVENMMRLTKYAVDLADMKGH